MSRDIIQDKLKQLRVSVKQRWGALTDAELDAVDEKLNQLPALLRERYGYSREQTEKEIRLFLLNLNTTKQNPVEVVREALSDSTPEEEAHVEKRVL